MLVVHQGDGLVKEAVQVPGGVGVRCSVAPPRGAEMEQLVSGCEGLIMPDPSAAVQPAHQRTSPAGVSG